MVMKLFPAHHMGVESGNIHIFPRKVEKFFQCLQLYMITFLCDQIMVKCISMEWKRCQEVFYSNYRI